MRQRWKNGDVFLIPNSDGAYTPGQVIAKEAGQLASTFCAFFDQRVQTVEEGRDLKLCLDKCFSAVLILPNKIIRSEWLIVSNQEIVLPKKMYPYKGLFRIGKLVGTVYGSGTIEELTNAFYALQPWDNFGSKDYLDDLLIAPEKNPKKLIYLND